MEFRMKCPNEHEWVESFPLDHPLFGICPHMLHVNDSRGQIMCLGKGKVIERVDKEGT